MVSDVHCRLGTLARLLKVTEALPVEILQSLTERRHRLKLPKSQYRSRYRAERALYMQAVL